MADLRALDQGQCEVHGFPLPLYVCVCVGGGGLNSVLLVDGASSFNREVKPGGVTFGGVVPLRGDLLPNDKRHRLLGGCMGALD